MTSHPGKQTFAITYCPISQEVKAMRQWNLVTVVSQGNCC